MAPDNDACFCEGPGCIAPDHLIRCQLLTGVVRWERTKTEANLFGYRGAVQAAVQALWRAAYPLVRQFEVL